MAESTFFQRSSHCRGDTHSSFNCSTRAHCQADTRAHCQADTRAHCQADTRAHCQADTRASARPTPAPTANPRTNPQTGKEILVALYHATNGPNWFNNDNWLSNTPIGEWHGVTVGSGGRVTQLSLRLNELTGVIPPELGNPASLTTLDLRSNDLSGEIPPELGKPYQPDDAGPPV